ncbi:MAG: enolase C-terminal domain-like protein, partial [Solirubrobacterales bacterium]
ERTLAPQLIGADPLDLAACERLAIPSMKRLVTLRDLTPLHAYSGIEMALWDIAGKATGRPLYSLLGGRVRDRVTFTEYFALESGTGDDPQQVVDACAKAASEHGANAFEGKVGVLSLERELEMVRGIRGAVGDEALIRLDANMSWDLAAARIRSTFRWRSATGCRELSPS